MSREEPRVLVVEVPDAAVDPADALASADADLAVRTAPGERVIERLREGEAAADCVVLGHAPPDVNGMALFDRLREAGASVPCVLVASDAAAVARALEAGVADAVRGDDPAAAPALAARVRRVAAGGPERRGRRNRRNRRNRRDPRDGEMGEPLRGLHAATRELMAAGTREAVAGVAAAAAADVLDAPRADLCVPAGDDDLVPLAVEGPEGTDGAAGANGTDGGEKPAEGTAVDVDAGPRGEAYRRGETVRAAPGDDAPLGLAAFARALCVPVEDRGVLTVARRRAGGTEGANGDGSASDGFGPAEVTCTEVLARNTAVALDSIERARRLERERDRLDEFAGVISHDLRGPLSAALARVQAAREMAAAGETEPTRDQLREAESSLERMDELVDDALTLARQGKVTGEPEPTPLGRVVEDAWASVRTADATLVGADRLPTVPADGERARTLFENLFRNSVEHGSTGSRPEADDSVEQGATGDPPTVTVEVGPLPDDGGESEAEPEGVYVADDGPGIPPENRDRVFERGFTTREGGSGLGLFIVERVAAAHGWTVTAVEGDDGARFEIRF